MAQPPAYSRSFSFTNQSTNFPTTPQPGLRLDTEFNNLATSIAGIRTNMALLQRDDGALANTSVGLDQLKAEVLVGMRNLANLGTVTEEDINDLLDEAMAGAASLTAANVFTTTQNVRAGTATTLRDYLVLQPTDYGAGKPRLVVRKSATADTWLLVVEDGAGGTPKLDIQGGVTLNGDTPYTDDNLDLTNYQTAADAQRIAIRYAYAR
jgi:hypothetical protein